MACRINRRRLWTARLMLESYCHDVPAYFVTLTYAPDFYPQGGTLVPDHPKNWLKRLRSASGDRVRFYLVGEYGDVSFRAHYHCVLFGLTQPRLIAKCWPYGHVHIGSVTTESMSYVAGYTVKKMTRSDDPRLGGRHPEFCRMSLKPGIGALAMGRISDHVLSSVGAKLLSVEGDVPSSIRMEGKVWPLGRYLRRLIREGAGFDDIRTPQRALNERAFKTWLELRKPGAFEKRERSRRGAEAKLKFRQSLKRKELL